MNKMREEFEKCWLECGNCEENDIYNTNEYEVFKFAWQASRAALCVEIPTDGEASSFGDYVVFDSDDVRAMLDAAGVRYK